MQKKFTALERTYQDSVFVTVFHEKDKTREEDLEISRLDGYDAGQKDGFAKGEKSGERKAVLDITHNLKKAGIALETIATNTGLSMAEIEKL